MRGVAYPAVGARGSAPGTQSFGAPRAPCAPPRPRVAHDASAQFVTPACNSLKTRKFCVGRAVVRGMNEKLSLIAAILIALLTAAGLPVYRVAYAEDRMH